MAEYLSRALILHLIAFQSLMLLGVLTNIWMTRRARRHAAPLDPPMVSILVPARNEAGNIAACVQSLLAQDYASFEVLALDDQSSDDTLPILEGMAGSQPRLRVLKGSAPGEGNVGKSWACSQLARAAQGKLLFFTDADTRHRPDTVRSMVQALLGEQADLLTGFPRQEMHSWGERLLVPFFSWACLCFNPLVLEYALRIPSLSIAVGQMMLFRREAYLAIGGHGSVSSSIVDDLGLTRRIIAAGLRWRVAHVADLISCRMYLSSAEAIGGFSKNLFAAFEARVIPYALAFAWLMVMFWVPLVVLVLRLVGLAPQAQAGALGICVGLSVLVWSVPYVNLGLPVGLALLYPLTVLANVVVAAQSLVRSLHGQLTWKGRQVLRPKWKWL